MGSTTEAKELQQTASDVSTSVLTYKTCVLKVSLHCKGCGKSITKILKDVDGVYKTEVDFVHQTVTVCGNMEVETLKKVLKKKTSKHVEVLEQELPKSKPKDKAESKDKRKEDQKECKDNQLGNVDEDKKNGKQVMKAEVVEVKKCDDGRKDKQFEVGECSYGVKIHEGESKEAETGNLPEKLPENSPQAVEKPSGPGEKSDNVKICDGKKSCEPNTGSVKSPHALHYRAAHPSIGYSDEPVLRATATNADCGDLGSEADHGNLGHLLQCPQTYYSQSDSYSANVSAETFALFSDDNTNGCIVM